MTTEKLTNRGIGTTEAAETSMSTPVETKEGQDVDVKSVAHRLVLLIIHLKEQHIRIHLCQLAYLQYTPQAQQKRRYYYFSQRTKK